MRALLVFVAAIGLPLAALAQPASTPNPTPSIAPAPPAADSGKSTEVSELIVQARKATEMSGLTVKGSCQIPVDSQEYSARYDPHGSTTQWDASSDSLNKRTGESPGTREFILRTITDFRNGTADYAHMGGSVAGTTRANLPQEKLWIVCRGIFKDIKFLHVSQAGYDDFEVDFSDGAIEWEVKPLNSHQVTEHWAARFYYPQPLTKQFDEFLKSMEWGRPSYADLKPGFAAVVQAQWPELQKSFKNWHGTHSIYFVRQEDDGSYTYFVDYSHHRVVWEVAPLDGTGKITGLKFGEVPN
jgi:hypothetical protein